jgi:hypothetical protein
VEEKDRPTFGFSEDDEQNSPGLLSGEEVSTETISLRGAFSRDVTSSGSFDIRGEIWATTFGKVLQALPIPALLIDQRLLIVAANQACGKLNADSERLQGTSFHSLFPDPTEVKKAEAILKEVFSSRRPRTTEAKLGIGRNPISGRMTFRSIRIMADRFILVLVEDLTTEKKLLRLSKKYQENLEKRVDERTAELREINDLSPISLESAGGGEGEALVSRREERVGIVLAGGEGGGRGRRVRRVGLTTALGIDEPIFLALRIASFPTTASILARLRAMLRSLSSS